MFTTAGNTFATAKTAGSEAGSACPKEDVDWATINSAGISARTARMGSARVARAGERVLAIAHFTLSSFLPTAGGSRRKDCFGATPKPAREPHALPRALDISLIIASRFPLESIRATLGVPQRFA